MSLEVNTKTKSLLFVAEELVTQAVSPTYYICIYMDSQDLNKTVKYFLMTTNGNLIPHFTHGHI